jgi:hypothetical protein
MYRDPVDEAARDDVAAAVGAHHELGRDYDEAVAESLVVSRERFAAEYGAPYLVAFCGQQPNAAQLKLILADDSVIRSQIMAKDPVLSA